MGQDCCEVLSLGGSRYGDAISWHADRGEGTDFREGQDEFNFEHGDIWCFLQNFRCQKMTSALKLSLALEGKVFHDRRAKVTWLSKKEGKICSQELRND